MKDKMWDTSVQPPQWADDNKDPLQETVDRLVAHDLDVKAQCVAQAKRLVERIKADPRQDQFEHVYQYLAALGKLLGCDVLTVSAELLLHARAGHLDDLS